MTDYETAFLLEFVAATAALLQSTPQPKGHGSGAITPTLIPTVSKNGWRRRIEAMTNYEKAFLRGFIDAVLDRESPFTFRSKARNAWLEGWIAADSTNTTEVEMENGEE